MSYQSRIVWLFFLFFPCLAFADQLIQYEPAVVRLSGKVITGKFQHPNGQWFAFSSLKLREPINIVRDTQNPINVSETGVKEIQIYSDSKAVRRILKKKSGKEATVEGTIFHGHTAWHVRPLVMAVSNVQ